MHIKHYIIRTLYTQSVFFSALYAHSYYSVLFKSLYANACRPDYKYYLPHERQGELQALKLVVNPGAGVPLAEGGASACRFAYKALNNTE